MGANRARTRVRAEEARQQRKAGRRAARSSCGATPEVAVAVAVAVIGRNLCGTVATLAALAGHLAVSRTPFLAFSWSAGVGNCVRALLKKPREFGMGSCDHAWRGHFPETFRRLAGALVVSAVNSRGSARPSVQARNQ